MKLCATFCMTWWFLQTAQSISHGELPLEESDLMGAVWEEEPLQADEMDYSLWEMPRDESPKCFGICSLNLDPVCGSDGETYSNQCVLNYESCMKPQDNIVLRHSGECGKGWNIENASIYPYNEDHPIIDALIHKKTSHPLFNITQLLMKQWEYPGEDIPAAVGRLIAPSMMATYRKAESSHSNYYCHGRELYKLYADPKTNCKLFHYCNHGFLSDHVLAIELTCENKNERFNEEKCACDNSGKCPSLGGCTNNVIISIMEEQNQDI